MIDKEAAKKANEEFEFITSQLRASGISFVDLKRVDGSFVLGGVSAEQQAQAQAILDTYDPVDAAKDTRLIALRKATTKAVEALGVTVYDQINAIRGRVPQARADQIDEQVTAERNRYIAAKAEVEAATTIEEVEAVDL